MLEECCQNRPKETVAACLKLNKYLCKLLVSPAGYRLQINYQSVWDSGSWIYLICAPLVTKEVTVVQTLKFNFKQIDCYASRLAAFPFLLKWKLPTCRALPGEAFSSDISNMNLVAAWQRVSKGCWISPALLHRPVILDHQLSPNIFTTGSRHLKSWKLEINQSFKTFFFFNL